MFIGCAPHIHEVGPRVMFRWGGPFGWVLNVGAFVLWVWVLVDVLSKETDENNMRLIWGLVVGFTWVIGAIIYLAVRRPERQKMLGR